MDKIFENTENTAENRIFTYTYSASVNKEVQEIRNRYIPKEESKLDVLKRLDKKVQMAGMTESLSVGIMGTLIFGIGMCAGLDVICGGMILAVILGIIGASFMIPAYPLYRTISNKAKEKYVPKILQLTDELEKNHHYKEEKNGK